MAARRTRWGREYPPLLLSSLITLLLLAVLPSALNLPQTDPTETLEYAPIPPEDQDITPPAGNFSSLGLGSSSGFTASEEPEPDLPPAGAIPRGTSKSPSTKKCVGQPPRQTSDKLAPPCVAHFQGDNGGATYQGVTRDEVQILFYMSPWAANTSGQPDQRPAQPNTYHDLMEPPRDEDPTMVRILRAYQRYFNERYQTYGRLVRFHVYFNSDFGEEPPTAESRRADAAANLARIKPFAVITSIYGGLDEPYLEVMARRGVLSFGSLVGRPASLFRKFPGLIWSYEPSLEQQAKIFTSYLCRKVVPHATSFSGNAGENGKPRRLGLLYTSDTTYPGLQLIKQVVERDVKACGGQIVLQRAFAEAGHYSAQNPEAAANMVSFRDAGVTTIIWPGGHEVQHTRAAASINYRPEWVLMGDKMTDASNAQQFQDASVFQHAWVVSNTLVMPPVRERECHRAGKESDPTLTDEQLDFWACRISYDSLRQLFTGIQVAGPHLGPPTVDRGFHAIPHVRSYDPSVPACFYEPGDYTCVKDGVAMWWPTASSGEICWKMAQVGARYIAGSWPEGDVLSMKRPTEPCSAHRANQ